MTAWAAEELKYADLGDMRRNKRLIRLVSDLAAQPNVSVPQASGDWAGTQAAYDFWQSPHVIEHLQLETAERIHRALATYTIVAWRLFWITYLARYQPDVPADTVLETHEWQALYCTIHHTVLPPPSPPSVHSCVRWIAQLGGFLARRRDGEPGVKTIWQGLRRLHDIAQTWLLVSPISTTHVKSNFVKKDASNA